MTKKIPISHSFAKNIKYKNSAVIS